MLRSNLTIHHTPTISYEEPALSKLGNFILIITCKIDILCISKIKKESIYTIDSKMKHSMDIIAKKSSIYEKILPDPSISPVIIIFKWISEAVPLSKSIIHKLESRSVADMGKIFSL